MRLPNPPARYDLSTESRRNQLLEQADAQNRKSRRDVTLIDDERLILRAPDGGLWQVEVANDGTLSASPATL